MAFTNNKDQVKKKNYNVFLALDNKSIYDVDAFSGVTSVVDALKNFPSNPTEILTTSPYTITNSTEDVVVLSSGSTVTNSSTDGKLRFVLRLATNDTVAYVGNSLETKLSGFLPIGVCLSEAEMKEEKGEDVRLLNGDFHVIEKNVSYSVIMPRSDNEIREFLNTLNLEKAGILFKDIDSRNYAYINNAPIFAGQSIKANALGQLTLSGTYTVSPETVVMCLGEET